MLEKINLPYSLNALEPFYSRETLDTHYNTWYSAYVDNTNKVEEKLKQARKNNDFEIDASNQSGFWNISDF